MGVHGTVGCPGSRILKAATVSSCWLNVFSRPVRICDEMNRARQERALYCRWVEISSESREARKDHRVTRHVSVEDFELRAESEFSRMSKRRSAADTVFLGCHPSGKFPREPFECGKDHEVAGELRT